MVERSQTHRGFALGVLLNAGFVVAEFIAGTQADSVALVADAAHNLGDVAGLILAWGAALLATRAPTKRRTYGWRKSTILAALANALLLIGANPVRLEQFGQQGAISGRQWLIVKMRCPPCKARIPIRCNAHELESL